MEKTGFHQALKKPIAEFVDMDPDKNQLRKEFARDWKKHYQLESLVKQGFRRQACNSCRKAFWAIEDRTQCGDPACIGYRFIGNSPCKKKLGYIQTWKVIEKYFTQHKHGYVKPYPTVARWRDDLYFTIASINDFQPYVVNGELEPPHNPLIVPQPCIRFVDISNVGISGRHYTNFVMIGQHAFNTRKTGTFYWKDEAIEHDIRYLKQLGIPLQEIVFVEDVWAGGGNFGPSMEYFVGGLELGNCVFMQYETTPQGPRELKTKVIDMGAGLARLAWITTGDPTSYEVVFGPVIREMKKDTGIEIDNDLFLRYARISGSLNEDEVDDLEKEKERVAGLLGIKKETLFKTLEPLQALYASADHLLTVLFAVTDGMLPSNAGGGYNLRMVLRRVFGFEEEFRLQLDIPKILHGHAQHLHYLFPQLKEGVEITNAVIEEEQRRYAATRQKAESMVLAIVKKAKGSENAPLKERDAPAKARIGPAELLTLYKSHGIPPEHVLEIARTNSVHVEMPGNFYKQVKEKEEDVKEEKAQWDVSKYEKTSGLYYTGKAEFHARVMGITGDYVILDQTAFYPEGGGQVADTGWLNDVDVKDVQKQDGVILHKVADVRKFSKVKKVKGKVDLERRKAITRHHTATHLVTAACREVLGAHAWQGGSYKDEKKAHVDITHYKRISHEELERIERKVNEYILTNMPIRVNVLPRNEAEQKYGFSLYQGGAVPGKELRVVSIGNVDHEACGGTHHMLQNTGEIGAFKLIKRESVQDGIERLTYKAGLAALAYMQEREDLLRDAATKLSIGESELPRTVERFFTEWKEQKKKIERLSETLVAEEAREIIEHGKEKPMVKIMDLDPGSLRKLGDKIARSEASMAVLMNPQGNIVCAAGKNAKTKANALLQAALAQLGGNGGGNEKLAQGKVKKVGKLNLP